MERSTEIPDGLVRVEPQPLTVNIKLVDDIFIKSTLIHKAGTYIPQHAHEYEHASVIAHGAVRVWRDGVLAGDFAAPCGITIPPHCKHTFLALKDETVVMCVHNISRAGEIEIADEHHLVKGR